MTGPDTRRMPAEFIERQRSYEAGTLQPAEPRHAATVVLLRDAVAGTGVEAYLLRRVPSMAFAARAYVFPGGAVDPRDGDGGHGWTGASPAELAGVLSADERLARALVCAAVRETFEESGVMLAGPSPQEIVDVADPEWERERQALLDRSESLAGLLSRRGLVLRADLLRPWAHWVTPVVEKRRYDTRFFVAALPPGQGTRDVGGEADRTVWMRPEQALAEHASGEFRMLPPTAFTLAELAEYPDVGSILAAAARRDVQPMLPKVVVTGDQARVLLPHEEGYGP
jgi:8-oxo-dGTP pyrophosphatase MutT (NUDIX family)